MDYTRLLERLSPSSDGESPVRHRTGIVSAVNMDGTVDVDLGDVVVTGVSRLAGSTVGVGDVVHILAWGGDMLILGAAL